MSIIMDNMGRPPGRPLPTNIDHLYSDHDEELEVVLLVHNNFSEPRGRHWAIAWQLAPLPDGKNAVFRQLQILQERGFAHYTNWGPLTQTLHLKGTAAPIAQVKICTLGRSGRAHLERIAENSPVYVPNGEWNCQNWCVDVLRRAVWEDIVSEADEQRALDIAMDSNMLFQCASREVSEPDSVPVGSIGILPSP